MKFRGEDPPQVHVSAVQHEDEWIFTVQDNGIGIEPQVLPRLFTVFARLHTQEPYPKPGIGLALCRKILERHGGRIWVESEPGKGSRFFFALPLLPVDSAPLV
jgi:light-regulated signal transduction histidine kinase (bacteriophytochrome)